MVKVDFQMSQREEHSITIECCSSQGQDEALHGCVETEKNGLREKKKRSMGFAGVQGLFHAFAHPPLVSVNIFFLWLVRTTNGLRSRFSSGREGIADDQNKTG